MRPEQRCTSARCDSSALAHSPQTEQLISSAECAFPWNFSKSGISDKKFGDHFIFLEKLMNRRCRGGFSETRFRMNRWGSDDNVGVIEGMDSVDPFPGTYRSGGHTRRAYQGAHGPISGATNLLNRGSICTLFANCLECTKSLQVLLFFD